MAVLDNARHELFAQALARGKTADEAYQEAGYEENRGNASRLKSNESIEARVAELQAAVAEKATVDAAWVLDRLAEEADADLADLYQDGRLKPINEWPVVWRKGLVAGLDVEEITADGAFIGNVKKLKLSDRIKRIELIGKHVAVQAFRDRIEATGKDGTPLIPEDVGNRDLAKAVIVLLGKAVASET